MPQQIAGKRILVVLAHPDDETFGCGGTLARWAAQGAVITLVSATKGEMGRRLGVPPFATRERLPAIREVELRAACDALGVRDLRFLGLRDKTVDYYDPVDVAERIAPIMGELKPDLVVTFHEVISGHSDHCATGRAATLAHRKALPQVPLYYLLWASRYKEQLAAIGAEESQVTAISVEGSAAEAKVRALRAHRTQTLLIEWLWDDAEAVRRLSGTEYLLEANTQ